MTLHPLARVSVPKVTISGVDEMSACRNNGVRPDSEYGLQFR